MVISMVSIKVSIMVSIKVRQNINKMKWMNHISELRNFFERYQSFRGGSRWYYMYIESQKATRSSSQCN